MSIRLEQRQSQSLVMSPVMQQAVALLVMSTLELQQHIQQELETNPTLEDDKGDAAEADETPEDTPDSPPTEPAEAPATAEQAEAPETPEEPVSDTESPMEEIDYENLFSSRADDSMSSAPSSSGSERENVLEQTTSRDIPLSEHLLEQLAIAGASEPITHIARLIISKLNGDGFLGQSPAEFAEANGLDAVETEAAASLVRSFDPPGVGARDIREALLIQLDQEELSESDAYRIVRDHFDDLGANRIPKIAKDLDLSIEEVYAAIEQIKELEPRPGRSFGDSETSYVIPDVVVEKIDGKYVVSLRNDRIPNVRISNYYLRLFQKEKRSRNEVSQYLKGKLDSAFLLIKSIEKRQNTIYRVADCIVRNQNDFFEYGAKYLKPMTLRIVADDLGIHESTVSRVTTQKYMQSPQGVHELKYFFTSAIGTATGEDASARSVKMILSELVQAEDPKHPYSDQKLAELLERRGFSIARRTVTKYREQLEIPAAKQRIKY